MSKRISRTMLIVSVLLINLCMPMFAQGQKGDAGKAKKTEIWAILLDTKQEWFTEVIAGMNQAGEDMGVVVKIMSSNSDVAKEANLIDNYIAQQVDAISISPQSDEASVPAVERAVNAGIPVITWNSKVNSPESKYFVGVNNYDLGSKTGEYAADYIKRNMNGSAKIAVVGTSKYSIGIDRVNGFIDEVTKVPGVEIVAQQDAEFKEQSLSVTESILEANPETEIIWCWNQGALLGSLAAVKGKSNSDVILMGTDMSIDLARNMMEKDSKLVAVTTQQPYEIGYASIKAAVEVVKDGETANETLIPLKTYVQENLEELQKYLDDREYLIK
ncbi:MAG: substrate-binding domain-containing protein [Proteiniphilum sp.]|nr:substrate-binding domain-containing protein [Proteiniphilum sp.]